MRVLVVDDEVRLAESVRRCLAEQGIVCETATDGQVGYLRARHGDFDVVVLDILLPGLQGYEICRRLRADGVTTPILVLTAKDGEYDEADALDLGADDYLRKPFAAVVLIARVLALARRGNTGATGDLSVGDLVLRPRRREVSRRGMPVELTRREFALLHELMRRQNETLSKQELLEQVWGEDAWDRDTNLVEVYIGYLRRKIDAPFGTHTIRTVRGHGYRVQADA